MVSIVKIVSGGFHFNFDLTLLYVWMVVYDY